MRNLFKNLFCFSELIKNKDAALIYAVRLTVLLLAATVILSLSGAPDAAYSVLLAVGPLLNYLMNSKIKNNDK